MHEQWQAVASKVVQFGLGACWKPTTSAIQLSSMSCGRWEVSKDKALPTNAWTTKLCAKCCPPTLTQLSHHREAITGNRVAQKAAMLTAGFKCSSYKVVLFDSCVAHSVPRCLQRSRPNQVLLASTKHWSLQLMWSCSDNCWREQRRQRSTNPARLTITMNDHNQDPRVDAPQKVEGQRVGQIHSGKFHCPMSVDIFPPAKSM